MDNLTLNSGTGGSDLRTTEDASAKHHQHIILELDDGTTSPVALVGGTGVDAGGVLRVSLATDIGLPTGSNVLGAVTQSGTWTEANSTAILADTANIDTNVGTLAGAVTGTEMQVDIVTSALPTGASTAAKQPALGTAGSASADVLSIQGIASMTALVVDGSAVTQPVSGTVTANLSATDNAVLDNIDTQTSPPTSHYRNIDANAEAAIKGSGGVLFWLHAMNLTAAVAYVHLYDATTASVTPGTTTPDYTFPLPTQGDTNGAGFMASFPNGISFSNAITLVVTTTIDGSAGDPGTNGVFVNASYA